jgi:NADH:ubiquinone oxidoreductase subunit 6 (subunit J)
VSVPGTEGFEPPLADDLAPPVECPLDKRGTRLLAALMSKLTTSSTAIVGALAILPCLLALLGERSIGWWAALIVYPGAIAVLVLIVAVVRDVRARRYWALLAPVLVLFALCVGFLIWLAVAMQSFDIPVGG